MRLTKQLVLAIIKDLKKSDREWQVSGREIYFDSDDGETIVNLVKGFLGRIRIYYNGCPIPVWSPFLRFRLRCAVRTYLLQKALQVVELE